MGFIEITGYVNNKGSRTNFILCQEELKLPVNETLDFLKSYRVFSPQESNAIDNAI